MSDFSLDAMRAMHFGQHMQPIERVAAETVEEIQMLEDTYRDDIKCQSAHKNPENQHCTREVTHRMRDCSTPVWCMVCIAHVVVKEADIAAGVRCARCLKTAAECWRIEPFG